MLMFTFSYVIFTISTTSCVHYMFTILMFTIHYELQASSGVNTSVERNHQSDLLALLSAAASSSSQMNLHSRDAQIAHDIKECESRSKLRSAEMS